MSPRHHMARRPENQKPIRKRLDETAAAIRRGEAQFAGRIIYAAIDHKRVIDFRRSGPFLGILNGTQQPVLLSAFPRELPAVPRLDNKVLPCPACQKARCHCCAGSGKRICELCGGNGIQSVASNQSRRCLGCKGRKRVRCYFCAGSGQMSTGRQGGSTDDSAPPCSACLGNRRRTTIEAQPLAKFAHGALEGMLVLGPFRALRCERDGAIVTLRMAPDIDGNLPVVLIDKKGRAQMMGGVVET